MTHVARGLPWRIAWNSRATPVSTKLPSWGALIDSLVHASRSSSISYQLPPCWYDAWGALREPGAGTSGIGSRLEAL